MVLALEIGVVNLYDLYIKYASDHGHGHCDLGFSNFCDLHLRDSVIVYGFTVASFLIRRERIMVKIQTLYILV